MARAVFTYTFENTHLGYVRAEQPTEDPCWGRGDVFNIGMVKLEVSKKRRDIARGVSCIDLVASEATSKWLKKAAVERFLIDVLPKYGWDLVAVIPPEVQARREELLAPVAPVRPVLAETKIVNPAAVQPRPNVSSDTDTLVVSSAPPPTLPAQFRGSVEGDID